jgi:4-amino-4-deoxy-L-arabinose transferase-like glycosyltransferase
LQPAGEATRAARLALAMTVLALACLFFNNSTRYPYDIGFDANAHIAYIDYLIEHGSLPLATDGWETYQPPLYYVLAACIFHLTNAWLSLATTGVLVKLLSFLCGIGQVYLVYLAARWVFPRQAVQQFVAIVIAASIPMNIYSAHYVSNEPLAAFFIGLAFVMTMATIAQTGRAPTCVYALIGLSCGLSLLTKFTALAVMPLIVIMVVADLRAKKARWQSVMAVCAILVGTSALIAGWFYVRNWVHFGKPLVGNWDPLAGTTWWQDPGFHTAHYFSRLGLSFEHPYFAGSYSFLDGLFSTFWGDGLYAGMANSADRPPWNYDALAVTYLLAIPAMVFFAIGMVQAIRQSLRQADRYWLPLVGVFAIYGFSIAYMALKIPAYAQIKASYGLYIVMPFALVCAEGFSVFERALRARYWLAPGKWVLYGWLGVIFATVYGAYFIW